MEKRILSALMVMMIAMVCMPIHGMGESAYTDIQAIDLVLNRNSDTLGYRPDGSNFYALIKPDGLKITEEKYSSVYAISDYPCFKVEVPSSDGVHDEGILDDQGNEIVPPVYADVSMISSRWAYGIKLRPSTAEDKDYTYTNWSTNEKSFYRIDMVDFYYRGSFAGSLSRSDYDGNPTAYGDYLCVSTRDRTRIYYNSKMVKSTTTKDYSGEYTTSYKNRVTHYVHNGTGEEAFVEGCTLTADQVEKAIVYENGKFIDLQGKEPFKAAQNYDSVQASIKGYAVVSMNYKKGVIDQNGREVIPLVYDNIDNYYGTLGCFGAIAVEKDGKFGYVDQAGKITCALTYSKDIVHNYGILATVKNLDGTTIVLSGLAGELPEHYPSVEMVYNGRGFVAENESGEKSLIDATGEVLIPYMDTNAIYVNREATVAYCGMGRRNYRIYTFRHEDPVQNKGTEESRQDEDAPVEASDTWTCSKGHGGNTGNFCPVCGEKKPTGDVVCPVCGTIYSGEDVPNFCPEDGTKLK